VRLVTHCRVNLYTELYGPGVSLTMSPSRAPSVFGRARLSRLLIVGAVVFAVALASYLLYALTHPTDYTLYPVDLRVYRDGGLIVRQVAPTYQPGLKSPLYDWPSGSSTALKFTYTPWAAIVFAAVSFIPWAVLPTLSVAANIAALVAICWFTTGGLGYSGQARLGAALLGAGAVLWTEPVVRTLFLGQINLVLAALILTDLLQVPGKRYTGVATGLAAGIKLVPLIFIPYLILTRRFRAAIVATAAFAATIAVGFAVLPADSGTWWLGGLFLDDRRTGFPGWGGNQSLRGLIIRLAGSVQGGLVPWLLAAAVTAVAGLVAAALLHRSGHTVAGLLTAALTGLLISPVSWDHHWIWLAPGLVMTGHYAVVAWRESRRTTAVLWGMGSVVMAGIFWSWPVGPMGSGWFNYGLIWAAPESRVSYFAAHGDRGWFSEYHWFGWERLAGNAYVLTGLALLAVAVYAAGSCQGWGFLVSHCQKPRWRGPAMK
jgi:alpha-1,2-mannosyltransferase